MAWALVAVLLVVVAVSFTRVKYWATGRNPCGHRPVLANVIGNLGDTVTVRSSRYVDECTTANFATVPTQIFMIESRPTDRPPLAVVAAALTSSGWQNCSSSPPERGCVQSTNQAYRAIMTAKPDRTVELVVIDTRNKLDCNKGCG